MDCAFGAVSEKSLPHTRSSRFFPMLSFRSFIVLHFPFRPMIHLELIFVMDVRSVSRFLSFFLHVDVQVFQHHLLKRLSFFYCIAFALLSKTS